MGTGGTRSAAEFGFCWLLFVRPVSLGCLFQSHRDVDPAGCCVHQLWPWTQRRAPRQLHVLSDQIRLLSWCLLPPCSVAPSLLMSILSIVPPVPGMSCHTLQNVTPDFPVAQFPGLTPMAKRFSGVQKRFDVCQEWPVLDVVQRGRTRQICPRWAPISVGEEGPVWWGLLDCPPWCGQVAGRDKLGCGNPTVRSWSAWLSSVWVLKP